MKTRLDWNNHPELLEFVANALESAMSESPDVISVWASEESGSYGEQGIIDVSLSNGRKFRLELTEIC